ncbi:MAG TPA: O-antigen ligase family protein [Burkholderiales bacterium]|nr:O-antigen ligase family protein [Burkholderiales bacterium]
MMMASRDDITTYGSFPASPLLKACAILGIALVCVLWGVSVVVAEWNALFVGLAVIACILILIDFRVGVVLLMLLMPLSYSQFFPRQIAGITGLNPVNLLLMGTLTSYFMYALTNRSIARSVPRPLLWLYAAPFVVAGILGSRHVGDIAFFFVVSEQVHFVNTVGYLRDMVVKPLFLVAFAILVGAAVARTRSSEKFLVPTLASMWIMSLMVVVYFVLSGSSLRQIAGTSAREFLTPLGMHANELGRMYVIAYGILLFTWAGTKDYWTKVVLLATMAIVVVALALTFSRGSFAGFVLVSALFLVSRRNIAGLLFGGLFAAIVFFFLPDAVYERATHGFGAGANAISAGRIDMIWKPLIPDLLRSPLYGNGIGSMLWSDAVRSGRSLLVTHPHNAYLQTWLDMGIIGLVLVCAYFVHVWKGLRALGRDPELRGDQRGFFEGAAAGLAAFLVTAFADGSLTPKPEQIFLWLAIGMMYGHRARKVTS